MTKRVIVTGASGFLGGHFAAAFGEAGWEVTPAERAEVSERDRFRALVEREAPAAIVHLAAPASVPQSFADPHADFLGHMVPLANVLDAARLSAGGARVILISSAAVYGNPESLPVDEGASLAPISPYAFHKIQQELLLDEYVTLHGVRACKVRLFSTYGENQRRLAVWEMTRRALAGDVHVLGSGEETRDYLYAGDAARAVVRIAEAAQCAGEAINVSSGQEVSIRELAAEIYRLAGITAPPQFTGEQMPGSPTRWRADVTRLRALGFDPPGWAAGLAQTIDWIRTEP